MKFEEFNLNKKVKVKLKPKGMIHLLENHKNITGKYGDYVPLLDKDGYYHTQIHGLMTDFGGIPTFSMQDYFELNILIETNGKK